MRDAARQLVGQGAAEALLHEVLTFPDPALEILELWKSVLIDRADIIPDRVFLQGRLRTRCLFTTLERGAPLPPPGTLLPTRGVLATAAGKLGVHTADIGFVVQIPIAGAAPGMEVKVIDAFVAADNSQPIAPEAGGLITAVVEQSVVRLSVRVLAPTQDHRLARVAAHWVHPAKQVR